MASVHESIEIDAPVRVAYDQWTQFETFPDFMDGVKEVTQLDDTHLHWVAEIGGKREEWEAEITEQVPDERIAWRSLSGNGNAGTVAFEQVAPGRTRVTVGLEYDAAGLVEKAGSALGVDDRRVQADLQRFRKLVEARGADGGWRGEVHQGRVDSAASPTAGLTPVDEIRPG